MSLAASWLVALAALGAASVTSEPTPTAAEDQIMPGGWS